MGVDYVVIGFDMEVQPLVTHKAACPLCVSAICIDHLHMPRALLGHRCRERPWRRLCSNWVRHRSTTISYPQCSLTFMRERYLHRSFAYAKSAVGIGVMSVHNLFAYRVVSTVSTNIVSSHTKHCTIAYGITR